MYISSDTLMVNTSRRPKVNTSHIDYSNIFEPHYHNTPMNQQFPSSLDVGPFEIHAHYSDSQINGLVQQKKRA